MFTCSSRDKPNEKLLADLQNIVAQMRMEVHRSNQSISELQSALQKSNLRVAELEVANANSKDHFVRIEAALHKANQHIIVVEETMRGAEGKINGYAQPMQPPQAAGDLQKSPHGLETLATPVPSKQPLDSHTSEEALTPYSPRGPLEPPTLASASFIRSRPLQERVLSLELLVSNLWQFHVNSMWIPAPLPAESSIIPGRPNDNKDAFTFSRHMSALREELGSRIKRLEIALSDLQVNFGRTLQSIGGWENSGYRGQGVQFEEPAEGGATSI